MLFLVSLVLLNLMDIKDSQITAADLILLNQDRNNWLSTKLKKVSSQLW